MRPPSSLDSPVEVQFSCQTGWPTLSWLCVHIPPSWDPALSKQVAGTAPYSCQHASDLWGLNVMEFLIPSSFRSSPMGLDQTALLYLCTSLQSGCILRLCQIITHHAFVLLGKILNFMWHLRTLLVDLGIPCSEWTNSSNWLVPFVWKSPKATQEGS